MKRPSKFGQKNFEGRFVIQTNKTIIPEIKNQNKIIIPAKYESSVLKTEIFKQEALYRL